jgi:hypothetical protein
MNGYFQLLTVDVETFTIRQIRDWPHPDVMIESISLGHGGVDVAGDRSGNVYFGSIANLDFPVIATVDSGNIHRVCYDPRHESFWVTLDSGMGEHHRNRNGVAVLQKDGTVLHRFLFARNDVECLAFTADYGRAFVGTFDGELAIFDNTGDAPTLRHRVGGFPHQIIDCATTVGDRLYLLTQDGEVHRHNADGRREAGLGFTRRCVWDIRAVPGSARPTSSDATSVRLLAATDSGGMVLSVRAGDSERAPTVVVESQFVTDLGFSRRLVPVGPDESVGIAWPNTVFCARTDDNPETLRWETPMGSNVHDVAVRDGLVQVATTDATVLISLTSGAVLESVPTTAPAWISVLPEGREERLFGTRSGDLVCLDSQGDVQWSTRVGGYLKRAGVVDGDLYVTGGGGVRRFQGIGTTVLQTYVELLDNTVENFARAGDVIVCVTYGMQVAMYDVATGELLDLHEEVEDFAKALCTVRLAGRWYAFVGGRGGYLTVYAIDEIATDFPQPTRRKALLRLHTTYPHLLADRDGVTAREPVAAAPAP